MKKTYAVWGSGPAQWLMIREADYSEEAERLAQAEGFEDRDAWYVSVRCHPWDIDLHTRHDPSVKGFCEIPNVRERFEQETPADQLAAIYQALWGTHENFKTLCISADRFNEQMDKYLKDLQDLLPYVKKGSW